MSNHVNPNMSNREVADFTLVDFKTKQPWLNVDFANVTTTEMAATRVLAKGGRGAAPRVPFDGERTCTMKVDTQITPMKLFAMLAGTEILTSGKVFTRERLTLAAGKLTLSEEPVANSVTVYKADDDCGAAISATVAEKAATIEDGSDGDEYIVYYMANKEQGIQIVKFKSDVFPKAYTAYGETLYKTGRRAAADEARDPQSRSAGGIQPCAEQYGRPEHPFHDLRPLCRGWQRLPRYAAHRGLIKNLPFPHFLLFAFPPKRFGAALPPRSHLQKPSFYGWNRHSCRKKGAFTLPSIRALFPYHAHPIKNQSQRRQRSCEKSSPMRR